MKEMVLKRMALKARDKKGFTLVEVIVVLVILAILMAIAVPSLTGYIDKARNNGLIAQGTSAKTAVQTIISEAHSNGGVYTLNDGTILKFTPANWGTTPSGFDSDGKTGNAGVTLTKAVIELTGNANYSEVSGVGVASGGTQVTGLTVKFVDTPTKTATYAASNWAITG
jgi:prepilin-type N-terminal cleavage/methylation domain-containing protein